MAEEQVEKRILETFVRIGQVWGQTRKGIVVTFNGARVGTWMWNKSRMMVSAEKKEFKILIDRLQKEGILTQEPVDKIGEPEDDLLAGTTTGLVSIPLGSAAPGTLDHALKLEGYFLIDLDVAIVKEE